MDKEIFFSIIIPCYNVQEYVNKCIDSVLEQTYTNYEIIVINDGSKDNTIEKLKQYNDKKIKLINKENSGLSDTRNVGIQEAKGKYLMFLDSDDYWNDNNALYEIHNILIKQKLDLLIIGYKKYFEKTRKFIEKKKIDKLKKRNLKLLIDDNYLKACAWDKVIKREIIKKYEIYFPKNLYSEDIQWCIQLINCINSVGVYDNNFYIYRQRQGSISKKIGEKNVKDIYNMICFGEKKYKNENTLAFISYEYNVLLGIVSEKNIRKMINKELLKKIYSKKYLLEYSKCKKVKLTNWCIKFLGVKITSILLGFYIGKKQDKLV